MVAVGSIAQNEGQQKARIPIGGAGLFASELRVVCAWCGLVMQDHPGPVSHSCCAACRQRFFDKGKDRVQ